MLCRQRGDDLTLIIIFGSVTHEKIMSIGKKKQRTKHVRIMCFNPAMTASSSLAPFQKHWQLFMHCIRKNTFKIFCVITTPLTKPWPTWHFSILYRSTSTTVLSLTISILNSLPIQSGPINPLCLYGTPKISLLLWCFSRVDFMFSHWGKGWMTSIQFSLKNLSDNLVTINRTNYMLSPLGTSQIMRKTINFPSLEQKEE